MAETAKAVTTLEIGAESGFQIPVSLKKITQKKDVSLDTASPGGNPLKQQYVDLVTGELVESDARRSGVFRSKATKSDKGTWGDFVEIAAEDMEVIEEATKFDNMTVDHFIPLRDVPFERVTDAYFLAPASGMTAKPLVLFAKALRKSKRAGVFKLCKSSRQYLAVVYEKNGGLIVNTLAYAGDFGAVHEAAEALEKQAVKVKPAEVEMAVKLIEVLADDSDVLDGFEDDLVSLKADLVERALSGKKLTRSPKKSAVPVVEDGLEAKLRESLQHAAHRVPSREAPVLG